MDRQKIKGHINHSVEKIIESVKIHRRKALSSFLAISILSSGSLIGNAFYQSQLVDLYHVYYDGKLVGTVNSKAVIESWISSKLKEEGKSYEGSSLALKEEITFKHDRAFKGKYNNEATIDALDKSIQISAKAFQLVVNGKVIGYVKSEAEGKALLEKVKSAYTKEFVSVKQKGNTVRAASADSANSASANGEKLLSVSIKEPIEFKPVMIDPEQLTDEEDLYQLLQKGTVEEKIYKIQEGDTLSEIAHKFNLKVSDLIRLNPGLTEDTLLQIGQQINVTALDPQVTVQTVIQKTNRQNIPYQTKYIEDKSLYKGQTKVKQKGVEGQKEVTLQITEENGIVTDQKVVDSTVISEPKDQIVIKGVKSLPVAPTGMFRWPVYGGYVTSGFGYRWGKLHPALDISGVKDKTIMAADNGTVISAGWDGSYGNNIMIDHGNGYVTRYAHLSKISVKKGQKVAKGQAIGIMGETGNATGVHLHFEIIKNGTPVNPSKYF
ncbi:peptidoglycan DD-metalloendopeptidase family protein [Thermicanus aegyptius]|uniref:peptidoglycan DD-metalloendopeptidase family protein n=1 Tax=Thermicanus aegyptius TaxID=94009 RepID=UPI0004136CFE|nr:M23 family metallopeptidase [Thermicanus aegyptius]